MNLLYVSLAYPPSIGGGEIHLHRLACRMAADGDAARAICQWSEQRSDWLRGATVRCAEPAVYVEDGIEVARLGFSRATRARMTPWIWLYKQRALRGAAIGPIARAMGPAFRAAAARGPVELIHALRMGCEFLVTAALAEARRRGVPFVITALHHPGWTGRRFRHHDRIFRAADAVIALTESERRTLVEEKGVDAARVHVTGIGPILAEGAGEPEAVARFRARHGLGDGPYVLFVGRKAPHKGWDLLLDAAPAILRGRPDARIVFVGPDTPASTARFAALDARDERRVVNLGAVDLESKTAALAGCALLALPSTGESFGGVFTEAWSFGRPVVGVDLPSVACVVEHERDGLLIRPDAGALAEAVGALLDDPARADALGAAGRRKVRERYGWGALARTTRDVYRAATSSR